MSPRFLAVRSHEDDRQLPPDYSKRKITLDDAEDEDSGSGEDSKLDPRLTIPAKGIRTVRKRHYGCSCTQISLREPLEPNLIYIHQWQQVAPPDLRLTHTLLLLLPRLREKVLGREAQAFVSRRCARRRHNADRFHPAGPRGGPAPRKARAAVVGDGRISSGQRRVVLCVGVPAPLPLCHRGRRHYRLEDRPHGRAAVDLGHARARSGALDLRVVPSPRGGRRGDGRKRGHGAHAVRGPQRAGNAQGPQRRSAHGALSGAVRLGVLAHRLALRLPGLVVRARVVWLALRFISRFTRLAFLLLMRACVCVQVRVLVYLRRRVCVQRASHQRPRQRGGALWARAVARGTSVGPARRLPRAALGGRLVHGRYRRPLPPPPGLGPPPNFYFLVGSRALRSKWRFERAAPIGRNHVDSR